MWLLLWNRPAIVKLERNVFQENIKTISRKDVIVRDVAIYSNVVSWTSSWVEAVHFLNLI